MSERTKKEPDSRRHKMALEVAFIVLKMVVISNNSVGGSSGGGSSGGKGEKSNC